MAASPTLAVKMRRAAGGLLAGCWLAGWLFGGVGGKWGGWWVDAITCTTPSARGPKERLSGGLLLLLLLLIAHARQLQNGRKNKAEVPSAVTSTISDQASYDYHIVRVILRRTPSYVVPSTFGLPILPGTV